MLTNDAKKEWHQQAVENFMLRMKSKEQEVPVKPTVPSFAVRRLRASLMLEECIETIRHGLGIEIEVKPTTGFSDWQFIDARRPSLLQLADGLGDCNVVNEGTGSAFGIALAPIYRIVMANNLSKFGPGHSYNELGKLVKPKNFVGPEFHIMGELIAQGADAEKDFGAWDNVA
jgi:predicted HAD superfamily Cof-like phosphohydrolase